MTSVREVEENVATWKMSEKMTEAEREELVRSLGALKKAYRYGQVCLRCGYCQPCPNEIDVPTLFRAHDMIREYPPELKYEGWNLLLGLPVMPDVCEACGECMKKCPAGINIPDRLKQITEMIKARRAQKSD
jgi:predicted aldo/keto reductase-like oxidoreductase